MVFNSIIQVAIPEGKKFKSSRSSDDKIIINLENDFKDGDYITVEGMTFISKEGSDTRYYVLISHNYDCEPCYDSSCGYSKDLYTPRLATKWEIKKLDDKLRKVGKKWNPITKKLECLPRWRASYPQSYYSVDTRSLEPICVKDTNDVVDNIKYTSGNYFRTREAAQRVAEEFRRIIKQNIEY